MRRRLPLLASLLLVLTCVMAVGVVCACSSDQSIQSVQRIVHADGSSASMYAPLQLWGLAWLTLVAMVVAPVLADRASARGRASPQVLQRFLF